MYNFKLLFVFACYILIQIPIAMSRPIYIAIMENIDGVQHYHRIRLPQNMERARRQVVQPKWLTDNVAPTFSQDSKVHVNAENLREVEEIRKAIQDAVDEGRFAVEGAQIDDDSPPSSMDNDETEQTTPTQQPQLWPFELPTMAPWFTPEQQNAFRDDMQRRWLEFWVNMQRFFGFNNQQQSD